MTKVFWVCLCGSTEQTDVWESDQLHLHYVVQQMVIIHSHSYLDDLRISWQRNPNRVYTEAKKGIKLD